MDDAVATLQQEYDMAVHLHGEDSPQAREAEQALRQLFEEEHAEDR